MSTIKRSPSLTNLVNICPSQAQNTLLFLTPEAPRPKYGIFVLEEANVGQNGQTWTLIDTTHQAKYFLFSAFGHQRALTSISGTLLKMGPPILTQGRPLNSEGCFRILGFCMLK